MRNRVYGSPAAAPEGLLLDGMTIRSGGFGLSGNPESLIPEVGASRVTGLTVGFDRDFDCDGIPTLVANHVPDGLDVMLQSENGLPGIGPFPTRDAVDPDLIVADRCVIACDKPGLRLVELAPGVSLDEVRARTTVALAIPRDLAA